MERLFSIYICFVFSFHFFSRRYLKVNSIWQRRRTLLNIYLPLLGPTPVSSIRPTTHLCVPNRLHKPIRKVSLISDFALLKRLDPFQIVDMAAYETICENEVDASRFDSILQIRQEDDLGPMLNVYMAVAGWTAGAVNFSIVQFWCEGVARSVRSMSLQNAPTLFGGVVCILHNSI